MVRYLRRPGIVEGWWKQVEGPGYTGSLGLNPFWWETVDGFEAGKRYDLITTLKLESDSMTQRRGAVLGSKNPN